MFDTSAVGWQPLRRRDPSLVWLRDLLEELDDRDLVLADQVRRVVTLSVSQAAVNVLQGRDRNSGVVSRHLSRLRAMGVVCGTRPLEVDLDELDALDPVSVTQPRASRSLRVAPATPVAPVDGYVEGNVQEATADDDIDDRGFWDDTSDAGRRAPDVDGCDLPDAGHGQVMQRLRTLQSIADAVTECMRAGRADLAAVVASALEHIPSPRDSGDGSEPRLIREPSTGDGETDPRAANAVSARPARDARTNRAAEKSPGRERELLFSLPHSGEAARPARTPSARVGSDRAAPRAEVADVAAAEHADLASAERVRTDDQLRELLAPLEEMARRCGVVGITSLVGVETALRPYDDTQVRHAVALLTRRLRVGDPIGSPFGLLTSKARTGDTAYFPAVNDSTNTASHLAAARSPQPDVVDSQLVVGQIDERSAHDPQAHDPAGHGREVEGREEHPLDGQQLAARARELSELLRSGVFKPAGDTPA